jgi:hypothetical protein
MISTFFSHELKAFWRSKNTGKSIALKVVMGILILFLLMYVVVLGVVLDLILAKMFPKENLTVAFCGIILVYFLFDLLMRMQLQELPTLKVQPYLHLPVKRNSVVGYQALTALFSFFNLWPIIIFTPFLFKVILHTSGGVAVAAFFISIVALSVFNNYLALYIKRKSNLNGWIFIIFGAGLALLSCGDYLWHLYSLKAVSYMFFGNLIAKPYLVLLPVLLSVVMFYVNFYYLKNNLYLEELTTKKGDGHKSSTEIPFLNRFGNVGDLVANEVKLIFRNKRPRSALTMGLFFLFYGLIFYTQPIYGDSMKVFVGMFMTGIFIISYGQFMFSWQGSHFDGLLVTNIDFKNFLKAKYLLFSIVSTIAFILTTPYAYFGWRVVLIHFVMYLWNLGINTTIVLYFANRNFKRIDLSKAASFNWEGVGATQMLLSLPLMLFPYVVFLPVKYALGNNAGFAALGVIAIIFILTRNFWIGKLEKDFYNKRYKIAEGFRNK